MKIGKILLLSAAIFTTSAGVIIAGLWWVLSEFFLSNCPRSTGGSFLERCSEIASYDLDQGVLFANVFGISVTSVSAVALIVTIYLTSKATEAAVRAADSAERSIDISREFTTLQLRPYLTTDAISLVWVLDDEEKIKQRYVQLLWENVGETPAINVMATANFAILDGALPADFDFPARDADNSAGSLAKSKKITSRTAPIDLNEFQEAIDEKKSFYLWSFVE